MSWVDRLARAMERVVPDALTTSILLLVLMFALSLSVGAEVGSAMDAYYRGLWNLLTFTMQMTLILVLSLILGATPAFRHLIALASRLPRTRVQVVIVAVLCGAIVAYLNWGLSIALSPVIATLFAREAERKGIQIDFLFLLATLAGVGSIWQFGFSGSAPLLVATPGHFLEKTTGIMPLSTTIWSPAALILVVTFTGAVMAVGVMLMPNRARPISEFVKDTELTAGSGAAPAAAGAAASVDGGVAKWLEHTPLVMLPLAVMLAGWLYQHFVVKQMSLDINSVNIARFTRALQDAVSRAWPIVLLYHLYAGVAGLIQFTPVGDFLVNLFTPILSPLSYSLLTAFISTLVALFIPTSGGQWLIQGFVTVETATLVGVSPQRGLLALSVGDHMGNLITPFWALVGASIAGIDFRQYFGYRLIFAALWFVMGVVAFTFLPC
jgi:short-chain fatty acids transporter